LLDLFKRFTPQLALLTVVCIIAGIGFTKEKITPTSNDIQFKNTIIIDAGHGGFDGGAVAGDGTVEKDINLSISLTLQKILTFYGFEVIMTRTEDTSTESTEGSIASKKKSDLKNRLSLMQENPDAIYVSVHLNKFTTSAANGTQVFYSPNFDMSRDLGQFIQQSVVKLLQPENNRVIKQGTSSTYLLHKAYVPAVIVECGFLSNKTELELLKNEEYQKKMAFCIFCGINNYFCKGDNNVTED